MLPLGALAIGIYESKSELNRNTGNIDVLIKVMGIYTNVVQLSMLIYSKQMMGSCRLKNIVRIWIL